MEIHVGVKPVCHKILTEKVNLECHSKEQFNNRENFKEHTEKVDATQEDKTKTEG